MGFSIWGGGAFCAWSGIDRQEDQGDGPVKFADGRFATTRRRHPDPTLPLSHRWSRPIFNDVLVEIGPHPWNPLPLFSPSSGGRPGLELPEKALGGLPSRCVGTHTGKSGTTILAHALPHPRRTTTRASRPLEPTV